MLASKTRIGVQCREYAEWNSLRKCVEVSSSGRLRFDSDANLSSNFAVPIAVIDGPYDHAALSEVLPRSPIRIVESGCAVNPNDACVHGTFIVGMLGARRDAIIPGLCPDSPLLHIPIFPDGAEPKTNVSSLARAICSAVGAGARLINLSLAIVGDERQHNRELSAALDLAYAKGVVILVSAGNQGRRASGQLLSHPATIPVAAVDQSGRLLSDSNFGSLIAQRGIAAVGHNVKGYSPNRTLTTMSGSSVATAMATGIVAKVWSSVPQTHGKLILEALRRLGPRSVSVPALLRPSRLIATLNQFMERKNNYDHMDQTGAVYTLPLHGGPKMDDQIALASRDTEPTEQFRPIVAPSQGATSGCGCSACTSSTSAPSQFIYVLGTVDVCFADQSVSEELESVARTARVTQGENEPLRTFCHRALMMEAGHLRARYIARQICWILRVEGQAAYYLVLRDYEDLVDLVNCLKHAEGDDLDLFVGTSPLQPVDLCPGLSLPVITVDQICSFKKERMLEWCSSPSKAPTKKREGRAQVPAGDDGDRLFRMLVRSADNFGDKDKWRALNFLAVHYKPLYEKYSELSNTFDLISIIVIPSRLSRDRRIVDPVFSFRDRETAIVKKFFIRVDVNYLFPMIVTPLSEYFDH